MSKFLRRNKEELKNKIFAKLNLSSIDQNDIAAQKNSLESRQTEQGLFKKLKQSQRRKLSIREQLNKSNPLDFSEEMIQLKWRIDALRSQTRNTPNSANLLNPNKTTSLTGNTLHHSSSMSKHAENSSQKSYKEMTFDELYQFQKKKYAQLRERRKNKINDPKYIEMLGNMQMRKEKRKLAAHQKIEDQFRMLDSVIHE